MKAIFVTIEDERGGIVGRAEITVSDLDGMPRLFFKLLDGEDWDKWGRTELQGSVKLQNVYAYSVWELMKVALNDCDGRPGSPNLIG